MVEIRQTVMEDAEYLARHLRPGDLREIAALGVPPRTAVVESVRTSDHVWTALHEGRVLMIFGVSELIYKEAPASIWALGTPECSKFKREMLRIGRSVVRDLLRTFPRMENWCDARYSESVRFVRHLGFTVDKPCEWGVNGEPFCHLHISAKNQEG